MADPHVLFCAFAEVPGASAAGTRTAQWLSVFGNKEVDALTLKGREAAHIQRLGGARMMRVPNTSGKPFLERLSTYQRALQRQLAGDQYDLVWCADLFSASVVATTIKEKIPMIVEVAEVPSQSLAGRTLVGEDTGVVQKRWREQERAAIRAATKVLLPSRHAAKLLAERVDARILQVVPRCIDRTVFTPPTVEIALDERLVLLFGGREGGNALKATVAIAAALAAKVPETTRIGVLGQPSLADAEVHAALAKKGLQGRVELVDADGAMAVAGQLSLAHVVVVPSAAEEDGEPFGMPHRALEAMACGRAVVVTGPEAAFRDAAQAGEHYAVAPAREPASAADVVVALLDNGARRDALGRAAARHVERTADLAARSVEVQQTIAEAARVKLRVHEPSVDDPDTNSRSAPPPPAVVAPSIRPTTSPSIAAPVVAAPKPEDTGPNPTSSPMHPMQTVRMPMPQFSEAPGLWEGDTFLDGNLPPALETSPDAARVRAAMLVSSDAQSKADSSVPSQSSSQSQPSQPPQVPTSLIVQEALDSKPPSSPSDPWAPDTIADGTPIETNRGADPSVLHRASTGKKSFLVDRAAPLSDPDPTADMTAEDGAVSSAASSASSSDED